MSNKSCRWCWYDRTDIGSLHFHWDIIGWCMAAITMVAGVSMKRVDIMLLALGTLISGMLMQAYGEPYFRKFWKRMDD